MALNTITADQFETDADLEGSADESYPHIYWRKRVLETGEPGDIVASAGWAQEFMQRIKEGWTPLPQFGEFQLVNQSEPGPNGRRGAWKLLLEPYRRILLHPEGPKEFSVRQIIEHGWHRNPPYKNINWTVEQRASMAAQQDLRCALCGRLFAEEIHLAKHQTIAHKEQSANEKLARALAESQGTGQGQLAEAIGLLGSVLSEQGAKLADLAERQQSSDERMEKMLHVLTSAAGQPKK